MSQHKNSILINEHALSLYVSVIANCIASLTTEYLVVLEKKKTMLLHCCMCTLYKYLLALYVTTKN